MRVGVKTSTFPPLSAEHQKSTMSQQGKTYPSIIHSDQSPTTLVQYEETSPCWYRCHSFTCHWLVFTTSDDESTVRPQHSSNDARNPVSRRAELSSSVHLNLCHPSTLTPTTDLFLTDVWDNDTTFSKENLPTAPLDDEVWF